MNAASVHAMQNLERIFSLVWKMRATLPDAEAVTKIDYPVLRTCRHSKVSVDKCNAYRKYF